jgi:alkanesulfonate monooxygenase SsuD/methylene tetrahydromethanopterin reductase-like flavin-dependent oxidoreductase (luciferase family)
LEHSPLRFGLNIATLGEFGHPRLVMRFAELAEAAGWEALFVWDHLAYVTGIPAGDSWVILSGVAATTRRLLLGPAVTPLPRRRLQTLAQTIVTLDQLSEGRFVLGVGLGGVAAEYEAFGEPGDAQVHGTMMDEGLPLLDHLLRGEMVEHAGEHYTVKGVTLQPRAQQQPRPPIWIGGESRAALRRAARYDGWVFAGDDENQQMAKSPEQVAEMVALIRDERGSAGPYAVAMTGISQAEDGALVARYAAAGVTWWLESIYGYRGSAAEMEERIAAGPPGQPHTK